MEPVENSPKQSLGNASSSMLVPLEAENPQEGPPPREPASAGPSTFSSAMFPASAPEPHRGWLPSTIAMAKCDVCSLSARGVVQKCVRCKLSICKECFAAGRLDGDALHHIDPDSVDWSVASRKPREKPSRPARTRGRVARIREAHQSRTRRIKANEAKAAASLTTNDNSSSPDSVASHITVKIRPDADLSSKQSTAGSHGAYIGAPKSEMEPSGTYSLSTLTIADGHGIPPSCEESAVSRTGDSAQNVPGTIHAPIASPSSVRLPAARDLIRDADRRQAQLQHQQQQQIDPRIVAEPNRQHQHQCTFRPKKRSLCDQQDQESHIPPSQQGHHHHVASDQDVRELGFRLASSAVATHRADPSSRLDECLRHEIVRCWSRGTEFLLIHHSNSGTRRSNNNNNNTDDGQGGKGEDVMRAFRALLSATYIATTSLRLDCLRNAAREWLVRQEEMLVRQSSTDTSLIRAMPWNSFAG